MNEELSDKTREELTFMLDVYSWTWFDYWLSDIKDGKKTTTIPQPILDKLNAALNAERSLDHIHLVLHETLGNEQRTQELRDWLSKPKTQPVMDPELKAAFDEMDVRQGPKRDD